MRRSFLGLFLGAAVCAMAWSGVAAAAPAVLSEYALAGLHITTAMTSHQPRLPAQTTLIPTNPAPTTRAATTRAAVPAAAVAVIPLPRPNPLRLQQDAPAPRAMLALDDRRLDMISAGATLVGVLSASRSILVLSGDKLAKTTAFSLPAATTTVLRLGDVARDKVVRIDP